MTIIQYSITINFVKNTFLIINRGRRKLLGEHVEPLRTEYGEYLQRRLSVGSDDEWFGSNGTEVPEKA